MKQLYPNNNDSLGNNKSFFKKLCRDSPFLVINTPCGVGKYKFNKIGYDNKDKMVLESKIIPLIFLCTLLNLQNHQRNIFVNDKRYLRN